MGPVIGGVVAGLLVVGLLVGIAIFWYIRRRRAGT